MHVSTEPVLVGAVPAGPLLQQELFKVFAVHAGALSSKTCQVRPGQVVKAGDLALLEGSVAEVWLHCSLPDGNHWMLLSIWKPLGKKRFQMTEDPKFVPTSCIERAFVYRRMPGNTVVVVP